MVLVRRIAWIVLLAASVRPGFAATPLPSPLSNGFVPPDPVTAAFEEQLTTFFMRSDAPKLESCALKFVRQVSAANRHDDAGAAALAATGYQSCILANQEAWILFRKSLLAGGGAPTCLATDQALDGLHGRVRSDVAISLGWIFCDGTATPTGGFHVPSDPATFRLVTAVAKAILKVHTRTSTCQIAFVDGLARAAGDPAAIDQAEFDLLQCTVRPMQAAFRSVERLYGASAGPACLDLGTAESFLYSNLRIEDVLEDVYCAQ